MFEVNDMVMYGHLGVCKIDDICMKDFTGSDKQLYYVLRPVFENNSVVYTPVNSEKSRVRELLTNDAVHDLIHRMPDMGINWIDDDKQRQAAYASVIKSGDHIELIKLISTLYLKREEKRNLGKKTRSSDEKLLGEAEKLLFQEFAVVLSVKPEDVTSYIKNELEEAN